MNDIKTLEAKIREAQNAYYNGTPIMEDFEFDALWDELKNLDPNNALFNEEVGADHTDGFEKAKHQIVMGSQSKANTEDEMTTFFKKVPGAKTVSFKMDGISLELNYIDGVFTQAITRGDGYEGDDITKNVCKMNFVPKTLTFPLTGAVRGEILLSRKNKKKYFPDAKNCRNMASGISKRLDGSDCDKLDIVCYDAQAVDMHVNENLFKTNSGMMNWLTSQNFKVAEWKLIDNPTGADAIAEVNSVFEKFDELEYDIDGLVFKNEITDWNDITTNLRPKTNIALKPKHQEKITKLVGIEWEVKNGTLTPIAQLEPVDLLGATVKKASLCNLSLIEELGIEIGDMVVVSRRNMIIPKVERKVIAMK